MGVIIFFGFILTKGRLATWNIALAGYGGLKTVKKKKKMNKRMLGISTVFLINVLKLELIRIKLHCL